MRRRRFLKTNRARPEHLVPTSAGASWANLGRKDYLTENNIVKFEAGRSPSFTAVLSVIAGSISLGGCAGAPSYELFGAYFPAWMLCALIGIIGGIAARVAFIAVGIDAILQFRLFVCLSAGLVVGTLVWLFWFGQ